MSAPTVSTWCRLEWWVFNAPTNTADQGFEQLPDCHDGPDCETCQILAGDITPADGWCRLEWWVFNASTDADDRAFERLPDCHDGPDCRSCQVLAGDTTSTVG